MANGELPQGWGVAPIGSLCTRTETLNPARQPRATFEYIDVSAISNESWSIIGSTTYLGSQAPSRARKLVRAGDVIFATVRPTLKRVAVVPADRDGQVASTAFCVLRGVSEKLDHRFLYYSLLTEDFTARMENLQRGASYPAVSDGDVMEQEIPLPPLPEQCAIAGVLSKLQGAVEAQDKIISTLKELKAATLAKLFREGLRGEPLKETGIGEIPESWEVVTVGDLVKLGSGATRPSEMAPSQTKEKPFPVYGGNGVMGFSNKFMTTEDSLVIGRVGAYSGVVHIAPSQSWITDNALYNRASLNSRTNLKFLSAILSYKRLSELQRQGAQPLVTQGVVHAVKIPLPSLEEQEDIARIITGLSDGIATASAALQTRQHLLSSMLHLLMSGEVRLESA